MENTKKAAWVLGIFFLGAFSPIEGSAEVRNYLQTFSYYTLKKGKFKLEFMTDHFSSKGGPSVWFHQSILEYGLTDYWGLRLFGEFIEGIGYAATRMETRYLLTEPGKSLVDSAIYLEASKHEPQASPPGLRSGIDEAQEALVISKDIGPWNFTANLSAGLSRENAAPTQTGKSIWEIRPGATLAGAYELTEHFTPGVEISTVRRQGSSILPGVYINLYKKKVRLNLGVSIPLDNLNKSREREAYWSLLQIAL